MLKLIATVGTLALLTGIAAPGLAQAGSIEVVKAAYTIKLGEPAAYDTYRGFSADQLAHLLFQLADAQSMAGVDLMLNVAAPARPSNKGHVAF